MAKPKSKQPLETITIKGSSVAIYLTPSRKGGKEYPGHTLVYTSSGRRVRKFVTDFAEARESAKTIAGQLAEGTGHVLALMPSEVADYHAAMKILRQHPDAHLAQVVTEWSNAKVALGPNGTLPDAVAAYLKVTAQGTLLQISISNLVAEFLTAKEREELSDRYIAECRLILARFKDAFRCNISSIQTADLQAYIDRLKLGARSKKNHRGTIVALFSHARRRGYLPRDLSTEADHLVTPKERAGKIGIYTPDHLHKVLKHATKLNRLAVALGAYAGLRSAELRRLDWEDIGEKYITVAADKAKTSERRLAPILPSLAAVLAKYKRGKDRIFPHTNDTHFSRFITKTIEAAGVTPVRNGLRHSFCTYRLADTQNAAQVALEAGNSPKMLFQHYRELATKEDATKYFEVLPVAA